MPFTEKNKSSPTLSTKFFLSSDYYFKNHYNINNKKNKNQYFDQQQKNQYSNTQQNKITEIKPLNQSYYQYKQQKSYQQSQQYNYKELKKQNLSSKMHNDFFNFSTEVATSNNNSFLTNEQHSKNLYSPSICIRLTSEQQKDHFYQKNIYEENTNKFNSMTISLPLTSWQQQKQKFKFIDDLEVSYFINNKFGI